MKNEIVKKIDQLTIACAEIEAREHRKTALLIVIEIRDMVNKIDEVESPFRDAIRLAQRANTPKTSDDIDLVVNNKAGDSWKSPDNEVKLIVEDNIDTKKVLLKQTQNCGLSYRTANCLRLEKIFYVGDLVDKTEDDLLKIKNFGRTCLAEVDEFLDKHNLTLKG